MGMATNGVLVYGYNLGDGDDWAIEEAGENGEWVPDWANDPDDPDIVEDAGKHLLASVGFVETDWRADGYRDRKKAAEARLGVELESYCSSQYPMWALSAHTITCYRGDAKVVDFPALDALRVEQDWDARLRHALTALGITPTQEKPYWLLLSYMG